jgi:hypothetical protein
MMGSFLFRKILPSLRARIRPIYVRKGILSEDSEVEQELKAQKRDS